MAVGTRRALVGEVGRGDPLVWTPTAVKAELARVRGVLDTINQEMSRAVTDGKVTGAEWQSWYDGPYKSGHKITDEGWSMWGSNVVAARQQEQAALKWRDLLKEKGAKTFGPADLGRKPDLLSPGMKVTGLVVGGVLLFLLLEKKL
jgi:hypothetical protein